MNGHLTLERLSIITPPEYAECRRCGISLARLSMGRDPNQNYCLDCQVVGRFRAPQQRKRGAERNMTADFEVTIHYSLSRYADSSFPVRNGINRAGFTYLLCVVEEDPVAHHYVTDVLGHHAWPVVTVTSYGRLLAHWEGLETPIGPNRYTQLQGLWDRVHE